MASPKVPNTKVPNAKIRIEDVITKEGKFDSDKFWKLSEAQIADLIGDAVHDVRTYIMQPSTHKEAAASVRLLEALDKENPDLGLSHYVTLFKSIESGNGSALTKSYFDSLKQYDPDTFNLYLKHPGWEAYDRPDFDFTMYRAENAPKDAEPSVGALTDKPLNNASPTETPSGALTNPPPEVPKKEIIIREPIDDAEINELITKGPERTYTDRVGNTEINEKDIPTFLTEKGGSLPKKGVVVGPDTPIIPAGEKPTASPSPEVKAAEAEAVAKETETKTGTDVKAETTAEPKVTSDAEMEGALTGNRFKNAFIKTWDFIKKHPKSSVGGLLTLAAAGYGVSQLPKLAKLPETKINFSRNRNEESESPEVFDNVNYRVWENYNPDYLNEEYVPGKIPSHIPQDYLDDKDLPDVTGNKNQSQVVSTSAPINNATADYVRAAYNSYIPSDAGRAYQKAIYGDPLELERNRLQQQQQKWRDFVMRSGQSPAELVQRGLMPYDALQYI